MHYSRVVLTEKLHILRYVNYDLNSDYKSSITLVWIPQWTVVFPPRERKFSISALTQSTAESGDCCDTCE